MSGLLIDGVLVPVSGLNIISPASHGGPTACQLGHDDYRMRPTTWVRQLILHSTSGKWPQRIIPGTGPRGHAIDILDMWRGADHGGGERIHSAAQLVIDHNGDVYCAADLQLHEALHAEGSNPWSIGIEGCTTADGSIYEAMLFAYIKLVLALTLSGVPGSGLFPIPLQIPKQPYRNRPLRGMETGSGPTHDRHQIGGPMMVGVFGHRDNTSERGFGDPGNEIMNRLVAAGAEELDYDNGQDVMLGKQRQTRLNELDAKAGNTYRPLVVDGIFGPASRDAMLRLGFRSWRDVR